MSSFVRQVAYTNVKGTIYSGVGVGIIQILYQHSEHISRLLLCH